MKSDYFDKSKERLSKQYGVDVFQDVLFGRKGRVLMYADISQKDDIKLHVISNSLSLLGLEDKSSILLSTLLSQVDIHNKYAELAGKKDYLNYVKEEMTAFYKDINVSFPITLDNQRRWLHFDGYSIDKNPDIYVYLAYDISGLMNEEELIFEKTHKDSLTGLYNGYAFDFHYGKRYQWENLHVFYMDIDNFKIINDQYSHLEGNKALISFADILKSLQSEYNLFYRLGGDEFVGLIFEEKDKVLKMAETIIQETRKIKLPGNNENLTVSIGVLQTTIRDDAVKKADDILYKAKRQGKDQYIFEVE